MKIDREKSKKRPLGIKEFEELRAVAGQLNWIANQTDLAYDACQISVNIKNVTKEDLLKVNKSIRRLKAENVESKFSHQGDPAKARFISFCDASLANLSDRGSQGGFIIILQGENGNFARLIRKSKKIKHTVKSTIAAETLTWLWCRKLVLQEMFNHKERKK